MIVTTNAFIDIFFCYYWFDLCLYLTGWLLLNFTIYMRISWTLINIWIHYLLSFSLPGKTILPSGHILHFLSLTRTIHMNGKMYSTAVAYNFGLSVFLSACICAHFIFQKWTLCLCFNAWIVTIKWGWEDSLCFFSTTKWVQKNRKRKKKKKNKVNCAFAINHHLVNWLQKAIVIQNITCVCVLCSLFSLKKEKRWENGTNAAIEAAITDTATTVACYISFSQLFTHFTFDYVKTGP